MKKADKAELDQLFSQFIKLFQSRCWACHKKCKDSTGFVIHHRVYREGEKTYKDFKLPNGKTDRLAEYTYLTPIIIKHHKQFRLLCNGNHYGAEKQARPKPPLFKRMAKLAKEINKRKWNK